MHVLNSIDELEHEVTDMLRLQRPPAKAYRFVEVPLGTVLKDEVGVRVGLEMME
jgi:hypothetical protein